MLTRYLQITHCVYPGHDTVFVVKGETEIFWNLSYDYIDRKQCEVNTVCSDVSEK